MWTVIIFSNKDCSFFDLSLGRKGRNFSPTLLWVVVPNNFSFITIRWAGVLAMNINSKRLLHDISKSTLVSARDFHIKPQSEAGFAYMGQGLIPGTIWKMSFHNLFVTYFTLTFFKHLLLYCSKDLWTDQSRK